MGMIEYVAVGLWTWVMKELGRPYSLGIAIVSAAVLSF